MEEPILQRMDPADFPIVSLTLSSKTHSPAELTRLADPGLTSALRGIAGVSKVTIIGEVKRELTVQLRPQALQAAGVSVAQVVQALAAQNLAAPVGRVTGSPGESQSAAPCLAGRSSRVARRTHLRPGTGGVPLSANRPGSVR